MNKIAKIKINPAKINSFVIESRPESKSNLVLKTEINGRIYYCERPNYQNFEFDLSVMIPAFNLEGDLIFGKKFEWLVDEDNRYWNPKELSSFFLAEYYIQHPQDYLRMSVRRMCDVQEIVRLMSEVQEHLGSADPAVFLTDLKTTKRCWDLLYRSGATFIFAADELVWQFRQALLEFLPKKEANLYFSEFLRAPITVEALKQGLVSEKIGARNILYSDVKPSVFYVEPEFFVQSKLDKEVFKKLAAANLPVEVKKRFYALRLIMPLCIQFNEENQYIESKTMSAHTVCLLKKIADLLIPNGLAQNFEETKNFTYDEVAEKLGSLISDNKNNQPAGDGLILSGLGVSQGKATGRVKIVRGHEDTSKFNEGDILVAKITDPSMVMMMAKSAAIVTDIGSMTSHPSIVSREMGIPCVVAAKNATGRLKDDMLVEVDGVAGTVRVLSDSVSKGISSKYDVDEFLNAFTDACCQMDFRTFDASVSWFRYDPLIAKSWIKRLLKMIDDCKNTGLASAETARLFTNTSDLRNKMIFDLWMTRYAGVSLTERMKIFNFYCDLLYAVCIEDPLAKEKNVIHTHEQIKNLLSDVKIATPDIARKLGRLVSACYHASHAMYSDMNPSNVYDNYLSYDVAGIYGSNHTVVIKEFSNLRPKELWPEAVGLCGDKIEIVCVYENVNSKIDSISHVTYEGDTIVGLKFFSIKLDGQDLPVEKITEVSEQIEKLSVSVFQQFKQLDLEQTKRLYYHQKAYGYKKIHERLGQDWKPSAEVLQEAAGWSLHTVNWPEDKEEQKRFFRRMLDPRVD